MSFFLLVCHFGPLILHMSKSYGVLFDQIADYLRAQTTIKQNRQRTKRRWRQGQRWWRDGSGNSNGDRYGNDNGDGNGNGNGYSGNDNGGDGDEMVSIATMVMMVMMAAAAAAVAVAVV